jgi:hypothetical protein
MKRFQLLLLLCVSLGAGCAHDDFISCTDNSGCLQGGVAGTCLQSPTSETKWCAFDDLSGCPGSGKRWGVKSGDGLAATCVDALALPDAGLSTGAPCEDDMECAGASATCTKMADGLAWFDGYCSNTCSASHSSGDTHLNSDCPGKGICTANGVCHSYCTAKDGSEPCRDHYLCFTDGCRPTDNYYCDRNHPSCLAGFTCVGTTDGVDAVGVCVQTCSVFTQACEPVMGVPQGCYISVQGDSAAISFCNPLPAQPAEVDASCAFLNDCAPGLACVRARPAATQMTCRPYCGGSMNVACAEGMCVRYVADDPSGVGVCTFP